MNASPWTYPDKSPEPSNLRPCGADADAVNTRLNAARAGTHKTGNVQPVGARQVAVAVVRGDQVARRLRQGPVHLAQLSVQGIEP